MDLIPLDHSVSKVVEEKFVLAKLYEEAGMHGRSRELKFEGVIKVCKENQIPVIEANGSGDIIYDWQGFDWSIKKISELKVNVPMSILLKMANVADKDSLAIAFPKEKVIDPVLLYCLPYSDGICFIELARWE